MKIAYYIYWNDGYESGVVKKISGQINFWKQQGHIVQLFVYTATDSSFYKDYANIPDKFNFKIDVTTFNNKISYLINSNNIFNKVNSFKPDVIYMRESKFSFGIYKLIKKFISVLEVNSISDNESNTKNIGFYYNRFTRNLNYNNHNGFVTVTYEIENHKLLQQYKGEKVTIGNSINLNSIRFLKNTPKSKNINIVFIGSAGQKWHGVDKIIQLAQMKKSWNFHIIGIEKKIPNCPNIKFYGRLNQNEYEEIFKTSDIAIGTLALHRNIMQEACPLKTREYLAYGLPVIIGYDDVDFQTEVNYLCMLPNNENNIVDNIIKINNFVMQWKGKRVKREFINHLDVSTKEQQRLTFLKKILKKREYQ